PHVLTVKWMMVFRLREQCMVPQGLAKLVRQPAGMLRVTLLRSVQLWYASKVNRISEQTKGPLRGALFSFRH
ncbi:MAG TPA: hypothetical protein DEA55_00385, partial [Rhodospirillaceae bacterium]|nr:hypothetical protein [Rhodospirillaceae bacterium]